MRKFILFLLFGFLFFTSKNQAQIVLKIANVEVTPGTPTATVDVTIDGFTSLVSAQFSINYDSLILSVNSVTNLNGTLGLSPTPGVNFGFPGTGNVKKGQLTFSWSDSQLSPRTLPNGTRLFSIVFNVLGGANTMSDITQTSNPLKIEYVNGSFMEVTNFSSQKGSVKIKNPGGGGGGGFVDPCPDQPCDNPTNLQFAGDTIRINEDGNICMPIKVKNFKNIQGGQGTFSWDTTKLMFVSVKAIGLTGTLFQSPPDGVNGLIKYSYFNNDPSMPINIADNTTVFEICFKIIGNPGDTTRLCIGSVAPPEMDWAAEIGGEIVSVPFCVKGGTVIITDLPPAPPVKIKLNSTTGKKDSTVCLDVRVEDFEMIRNMQFSVNYDASVLKYVSTGMYDLKGLSQGSFTNMNNSLIFSWNTGDNSVVSLADGHKIFQICFELIGPCNSTSAVSITSTPRVIEINGIYNNENDYAFESEITNGAITITCEVDPPMSKCEVNSTTNANCFGESNGSVNATVMAGTGLTNCMCVWKNSQGSVVKSSANLSDCSLANAAAGNYTLELICNGTVACMSSATVGQPDRINVPATGVTNVGCGSKGSITVSGVTGGNQPYSNEYKWSPNVGNTATVSNLDAGTYMVTVTDSKGCTGTQTYQVTNNITALTATATGSALKCFGDTDGTITVTPMGGCPPYTINPTLTNLPAGSYTVTVTDSSVPPNSTTATGTVTQPAAALNVVTTTVDTDAGQNNGSITLVITGGTPNYSIVWQSTATQIAANSNPALNLAAGFYNVTVTDANGCVKAVMNLEVKEKDVNSPPVFQTVGVTSNFNGFGVDCNGNCTGKIGGSVSGGNTPVKVSIKTGSVLVKEITLTALGSFEFTQLCAGKYIVEAVNNIGTIATQEITINQPSRLSGGSPDIECTNGSNEDGSITISINNTGTAPYTIQWSAGSSSTEILNNLGVGTYGVTVTDANGCRVTLNNLDVKSCDEEPGPCGIANIVLTPDGNQQNDVFIITCAEDLNGTLAMYDRWGRLVYNKAPYDNTFIGIDNDNEILPEGAYVWIYEVNYGNGNREVFSGTLTILK